MVRSSKYSNSSKSNSKCEKFMDYDYKVSEIKIFLEKINFRIEIYSVVYKYHCVYILFCILSDITCTFCGFL